MESTLCSVLQIKDHVCHQFDIHLLNELIFDCLILCFIEFPFLLTLEILYALVLLPFCPHLVGGCMSTQESDK
jgi:hypothetical protein